MPHSLLFFSFPSASPSISLCFYRYERIEFVAFPFVGPPPHAAAPSALVAGYPPLPFVARFRGGTDHAVPSRPSVGAPPPAGWLAPVGLVSRHLSPSAGPSSELESKLEPGGGLLHSRRRAAGPVR